MRSLHAWRNHEPWSQWLVSSFVLLMFFVQGRNPVPHYSFKKVLIFSEKKKWGRQASCHSYPGIINSPTLQQVHHDFFRKKTNSIIISSEKIKWILISSEKNQAQHYFLRKNSSASLFLLNEIKCIIISSEKMRIFFWRNNDALDFFLKK